jgi:hypothetical protein
MAKIKIPYNSSQPPYCRYNGKCWTLVGDTSTVDDTGAVIPATGTYQTYQTLQGCEQYVSPSPELPYMPDPYVSPSPLPWLVGCYVLCE